MTGCDGTTTAPTSPIDTEFTLAPAERRAIEGQSLVIRFIGVSGDSRCPADALCITGGSAAVQIAVTSAGGQGDYDLHTGNMSPVRHGGLTIALVQLSPYPFSARTIRPDEYRATFKVTR